MKLTLVNIKGTNGRELLLTATLLNIKSTNGGELLLAANFPKY